MFAWWMGLSVPFDGFDFFFHMGLIFVYMGLIHMVLVSLF